MSQRKFGVVEFCGGVMAISTAWAAQGVPVLGLVESQPILLKNAGLLHPRAKLCNDVYSNGWRSWQIDDDDIVEVVTGGPPCQPCSGAGPQHGPRHKDANQIFVLADAAVCLEARWAHYQNVHNLVQKFKEFFKESVQYYKCRDLLSLDDSVVRHDWIGGISVRALPRVWPLFEHAVVAQFPPP